ncbi:MAG: 2Fe-2S ferredoxin [Anaerolineae bacterium]|jgi:NADP-reducing hydrogenase subunit HndB|nr:MAG: 2Fe-2S ferredoxin [Anaerolineae bacterium]
MTKISSVEELRAFQQQQQLLRKQTLQENVMIYIGAGTCGLAAGAAETLEQIELELRKRNITAQITTVGCIGMCVREPLVDIQLPHQPRITYGNVKPEMVARIIDEHIIGGKPVLEWVVGVVPQDW